MSTATGVTHHATGGILEALDRHRLARWVIVVGSVLVVIAILTALYTRLSMTVPIGSDQASSALQGQDLASGNVLLKQWVLSPLSLYVPDLVLYAAVVSVVGPSPLAVHLANALMYAVLVVAAVVLARGAAGSRNRNVAALITGTLLIAPQLGLGTDLLLLEGSHVGVALLVVLALIVLDLGPRDLRTAAAAGAVLAAAVVADGLAIIVGSVPLAAVSALRLWRRGEDRHHDVGLLVAGVVSVPLGAATLLAVRALHGFHTYPLTSALAAPSDVPVFAGLAVKGIAALFGIEPGDAHGIAGYTGIAFHLVGFAFAATVGAQYALRFLRGHEHDRVSELLLAGMAANLGAFLFASHQLTGRYLIPFFVFAAILAGRAGAPWLAGQRQLRGATVVATGCVAVLLLSLGAAPAPNMHPWSAWLLEHHLYSGLGSYWQASSVTVETDGQVRVRPILSDGKQANGYAWESKQSWYQAAELGDVRFVIYDVTDKQFGIDRASMEAVFGPPSDSVTFGNIQILLWDHNIVPNFRTNG